MKKKNAFTLIELLAIIVILAIIAVITVPIILNIIENSKRGAATDSAYGYKDSIEKWYVSKLQEDSQFQLADSYTISSDGRLGNIEIPLSGNKPSGGYLNYSNNTLSGGCLVFGDYAVTFDSNGSASEAKKGTCEITVPSFADDSWADIKANLTTNRNFYAIGSQKEVEIDGTSYTVRLANTSSCEAGWTGSETACGVVIEFIDTIIDTDNNNTDGHVMNSSQTNAGGWPASSMYSYLNTTIFNKLPDELKTDGMIINTKSISGHGSQSGATNFTSTDDKLYLLSYVEVFGSNGDYDSVKLASETVTDGTRQLEYYGTPGSTRVKTTTSGSVKSWWLRSALSNGTNAFYTVNSADSTSYYTASNAGGVAPAFRILD